VARRVCSECNQPRVQKKFARKCSYCRNGTKPKINRTDHKELQHIDDRGGRDLQCSCSTWFKHYKNNIKGNIPAHCAVKLCTNPADTGAHVKKVGGKDHHWYIVATCNGCNWGKKGKILVNKRELISVYPQDNCKKN